ncbi:hypothetical protein JCM10212_003826 [Sporobolomyces blumeae]
MTTPFSPQADDVLLRRLSTIDHLVLVLSGKGGVGKSSVSVQLALSLLASDPTLNIGLLDVDLTGPSLPRMLGLEGREVLSSQDGWVPVYLDARLNPTSSDRGARGDGEATTTTPSGPSEASTSTRDNVDASTTRPPRGKLACMSIGFLLKNSRESVVWRGPKKNAMIKQFLGQVRWGHLDYLIVDTPPGTSDEHISLLETLRPLLVERPDPSPPLPTLSSLLVSTPQALALLDVSKELSFVRRTKLPLLGLIENMSGYCCPHCGEVVGVFGQGGGEDFCRREEERKDSDKEGEGGGCRFLGRIPIDRDLVALLDDVAEHRNVKLLSDHDEAEPSGDGRIARRGVASGDGGTDGRKTLVERYREISSFKVVQELAKEIKVLIAQQAEEERRNREAARAANGRDE